MFNFLNSQTYVVYKKLYLFSFLAFFIPFLLRVVPELLMGPYVVGFDTMGHYVPTSILWLNDGVSLGKFIATAPLFYSIVVSLTVSGGPLFLILKILPPLLHGFLGLSIYGYAKLGLGWSYKKSLIPALVGTVYFVALRISWDLLREQLALIFLFTILTLLAMNKYADFSWKRYFLLSLVMIAVILANQLVAVIMFGIIAFSVIYQLFQTKHDALRLALFSLPAGLLFLIIFFLSPAISEYRLIFGFNIVDDGWLELFGYSSYPAMLVSEAGFFLYCFLPLLPLAVLSAKRFDNFEMRSWILLIFIALLIPMVSPSNLRWIMMLIYPLAFYITDALSRFKCVRWKRANVTLLHLVVIYLTIILCVLSLGLTLTPPEQPFGYFDSSKFNSFVYQIPTSMLQNTVSISDCSGVTKSLAWVKDNLDTNTVILTHRAFYGWALSTLNSSQIILYEYDNPVDAASTLKNSYDNVYLIWWIDEQGWYGLPTVPSDFVELYRSGKIAIYNYVV